MGFCSTQGHVRIAGKEGFQEEGCSEAKPGRQGGSKKLATVVRLNTEDGFTFYVRFILKIGFESIANRVPLRGAPQLFDIFRGALQGFVSGSGSRAARRRKLEDVTALTIK